MIWGVKKFFSEKISRKILLAFFVTSGCLTALSTTFILVSQYVRETNEIERQATHIVDSNTDVLVEATWEVDVPLGRKILTAITNNPNLQYASILDETGEILAESGESDQLFSYKIEKPLNFLRTEGSGTLSEAHIGTIIVHVSEQSANKNMRESLFSILLVQAVKSFLFALLFVLIIHQLLVRHLLHITDHIRNTEMVDEVSPLRLQRATHDDELELVVDATNTSHQRIHSQYQTLIKQQKLLADEIFERKRVEKELRASSEALNEVFNSLTDWVLQCDAEGKIRFINQPAREGLKYNVSNAPSSRSSVSELLLLHSTKASDEQDKVDLLSVLKNCRQATRFEVYCTIEDRADSPVPVQVTLIPLQSDRQRGFIVLVRDETNKSKLKTLSYHAAHDFLTGLPNRYYFNQQFKAIIESNVSERYCYLIVDIDNFKHINDIHGHHAGDTILKQISVTLSVLIGEKDLIARFGGDEFIFLLNGDLNSCYRKAQQIIQVLEDSDLRWQGRQVDISASIGMSSVEPGDTITTAMQRADKACYTVKKSGGGYVEVSHRTPEDEENSALSMAELEDLIHTLRNESIVLHAQPIIPIQPQNGYRLEVLSRLKMRDRIVYPRRFMPVLKKYNHVPSLDMLVVKRIGQVMDEIKDAHWTVSINISPQSLAKPQHRKKILQFLKDIQPTNQMICLEITEDIFVQSSTPLAEFMAEARGLGAIFALDDFGSGYASFGMLTNYSFEIVKIDGIIVERIVREAPMLKLLESIVSTARLMGAYTVAERAPNREAINLLREMGVDYIQSAYTYSPRPLEYFLSHSPDNLFPYHGQAGAKFPGSEQVVVN